MQQIQNAWRQHSISAPDDRSLQLPIDFEFDSGDHTQSQASVCRLVGIQLCLLYDCACKYVHILFE
jgi:hypothetical protein